MGSSVKKNKGGNPVMAAVTGAIVGGIAVAGAMTLADEKKREQVKDTLVGAKNQAMDMVDDVRGKVSETLGDAAEEIKDVSKIIK